MESCSIDTSFYMRAVGPSGDAAYSRLCNVYSDSRVGSISPIDGFRPVFLLPSGVIISGGDGSSGNPYVIE